MHPGVQNGMVKNTAATDRNTVKVAIMTCKTGYTVSGPAVAYCNGNMGATGKWTKMGSCQHDGQACSKVQATLNSGCHGSPSAAMGCPGKASKLANCGKCDGDQCGASDGTCTPMMGGSCPSGSVSCAVCNPCSVPCIQGYVANLLKNCGLENPSGMWGMYAPLLGRSCVPSSSGS